MNWVTKFVIGFLILFGISAWLVGAYLAPDDLKKCGEMPSDTSGCVKADAVVAVSGGDTSARASEAVKLYQNGWAKYLIFSGAAADTSGPSNAEVMAKQAIAAGVDPAMVLIEPFSQTTGENAIETVNIFKQYDIRSAIIVTSSYHERRATLEFQHKAGPDVELRSHPVAHDKQWTKLWWLTPTGWYLAISELVKSVIVSVGGSV